jgi:hypothetical protein
MIEDGGEVDRAEDDDRLSVAAVDEADLTLVWNGNVAKLPARARDDDVDGLAFGRAETGVARDAPDRS